MRICKCVLVLSNNARRGLIAAAGLAEALYGGRDGDVDGGSGSGGNALFLLGVTATNSIHYTCGV